MIEKMVLFENQKQLEETRDELERFPKVMKIGIFKRNFFESVGTRDT